MDCGQDMPADVSSPDLEGLLLLLLACGGQGGGELRGVQWGGRENYLGTSYLLAHSSLRVDWFMSVSPVPRVSSCRDVALLFLPSTKQVPGLDLLNKCFWNKRRNWAMFLAQVKYFWKTLFFF